jgi:hypothetical protein
MVSKAGQFGTMEGVEDPARVKIACSTLEDGLYVPAHLLCLHGQLADEERRTKPG